jgi:hypothetical protein
MKQWMEREKKRHARSIFHRIPDSPFGGYKPADVFGVLTGTPWLLEFKMNRKKRDSLNLSDTKVVTKHQQFELARWRTGGGRSAVVIYDERYRTFIFWEAE